MSLHKLWSGDVAGYLSDNADTPDTFWLFQHIPKTAGTSFRHEFASQLRPSFNICLRGPGGAVVFETMQQAVDAFLKGRPAPPRFASGHLSRSHVAQISQRFPKARLITMLRRPEARVLSEYRYQRTLKHATHRAFIEQFPTLESYVEAPISQNRMFQNLQNKADDTVDDVLRDLQDHYAFVGVTEMYPFARRMLMRLMRLKGGPVQQRNRTLAAADGKLEDPEPLLPRIRQLNTKDQDLYRRVLDQLRSRREAFNAQTSNRIPVPQ